MPLEIHFDCRAFKPDKTPNMEVGVHLILTDGCMVDLRYSPPGSLSPGQEKSLELAKNDDKRKHRLCYLPISTMDFVFGSEGILRIFCPTCENEYSLTREQYQKAFEKFARGE